MVEMRRTRFAKNIASIEEKRNAYWIFVAKTYK
jgi:hypothetical protein